MAKKQTRRSISVSRGTYERLKAYCETNQISMSQFVERRVGDFLGRSGAAPAPAQPVRAGSAPAVTPVSAPTAEAAPAKPAVQSDAFTIPAVAAATVAPKPTRLSAMNQPLSQVVDAPKPAVVQPASDEPLLKDPDIKLTADQIFTF